MAQGWPEETERSAGFPVWSRSYASELAPGPVLPLDRDLLWSGGAARAWRSQLVGPLGFRPAEIPTGEMGLLGVFEGHLYLNASMLRVWADRTPVLDRAHVESAYLPADLPPHEVQPWHRNRSASEGALSRWLRSVLVDGDVVDVETVVRRALRARRSRPDFDRLLDDAVHERIVHLQPLLDQLLRAHLHQFLAAPVGPALIASLCERLGVAGQPVGMLSGIGGVATASPLKALWTLSRLVSHSATASAVFDGGPDGLEARLRSSVASDVRSLMAGVDALVDEVGLVDTVSWELSLDDVRSEVMSVLAALDLMRRSRDDGDPAVALASAGRRRAALVSEVAATVEARGSVAHRDQFLRAVRATEHYTRGRARVRQAMAVVRYELRLALAELARRAVRQGDIERPDHLRLLRADELAYYADGGLATIADITRDRARTATELANRPAAPWLDLAGSATPAALPGPVTAAAEGTMLWGRAASPLSVRGPVVVVDPEADGLVPPGAVLVADRASPAWLPHLVGAAAVITESGTMLDHLAVLCRELDVPLVFGVPGARRRLQTGTVVEVDGATGMVTVVGEVSSAPGGMLRHLRRDHPGVA